MQNKLETCKGVRNVDCNVNKKTVPSDSRWSYDTYFCCCRNFHCLGKYHTFARLFYRNTVMCEHHYLLVSRVVCGYTTLETRR